MVREGRRVCGICIRRDRPRGRPPSVPPHPESMGFTHFPLPDSHFNTHHELQQRAAQGAEQGVRCGVEGVEGVNGSLTSSSSSAWRMSSAALFENWVRRR